MKRISLGCGLLVFMVSFVTLAGLFAYAIVGDYFGDYAHPDRQMHLAISKELWLQEVFLHPSAPPCYTLDVTLCASAETVRNAEGDAYSSYSVLLIAVSAVPAVICSAVVWALLWFRRRRMQNRQDARMA